MRYRISDEYFDWLVDLMCADRFPSYISYNRLFAHLHSTRFTYLIPMDENRASDGIDLRRRFALYQGYEDEAYDMVIDMLSGPCSVLEMMIALAIRCEENIMDDPSIGDRTQQWFWVMITNLGLNSMTDDRFDPLYVRNAVDILLNREYEPDGRGGLFTIRDCRVDLRRVEIWHQLCKYLDSLEF